MFGSRCFAYCRDEDGALSIEALFWLVLVVTVMALFVDGTTMLNAQGKILRITQDADRAYSVGFLTSPADIQTYITNRLSGVAPTVTATSSLTGNIITTTVTAPATDFQVFGLFPAFKGLTITVNAVHMNEPG